MALAMSSCPIKLTRAKEKDTRDRDDMVSVRLPSNVRSPKVLILGGTGRVGGSTAVALKKLCPDLQIIVAGRNREKGRAMVATLGARSEFAQVNVGNVKSLEAALNDVDIVVHAAGPFQQTQTCTVLEAAIKTKTAYVDVCDVTSHAWFAKSMKNKAMAANVPALITAGLCPGISNVMAAELVRAARREGKGEPERLRFYYHVAGSGGGGTSLLLGSLLLLGDEVVAYDKGKRVKLKPYSGMLNVDFGKGIGKRDVYLLNLPEVRSAHEILGVPSVSARFGSEPSAWNRGMEVMASFPSEFIRDKSMMGHFVQLLDPIVRAVDVIVGEHVAMRVELECSDGHSTVALFSHKKLSVTVGTATAALVMAVLEGSTQPGVWFPEEPQGIAIEAREALLIRATQGTINFEMNKSKY